MHFHFIKTKRLHIHCDSVMTNKMTAIFASNIKPGSELKESKNRKIQLSFLSKIANELKLARYILICKEFATLRVIFQSPKSS